MRRPFIDAARVGENWFLAHIHSGGMVSDRRGNVNRQIICHRRRRGQSWKGQLAQGLESPPKNVTELLHVCPVAVTALV